MSTTTNQGGRSDEPEDADVECPSCDDAFDTERAMKIHHKRAHGESLAGPEPKVCDHCDSEFVPSGGSGGVYCSEDCANLDQRDRITLTCEVCGRDFEVIPSNDDQKYCSRDCFDSTRGQEEQKRCPGCGLLFETSKDTTYCSRVCFAEVESSKPRPTDLDMLVWLLYIYEDNNLEETWRRIRCIRRDPPTQEEVRDVIHENDWLDDSSGGRAQYEHLNPEDLELSDDTPDGDDSWQRHYQGVETDD